MSSKTELDTSFSDSTISIGGGIFTGGGLIIGIGTHVGAGLRLPMNSDNPNFVGIFPGIMICIGAGVFIGFGLIIGSGSFLGLWSKTRHRR